MEDHQHGVEPGEGPVRRHGNRVRQVAVLPIPAGVPEQHGHLHLPPDIPDGGSGAEAGNLEYSRLLPRFRADQQGTGLQRHAAVSLIKELVKLE